MDATNEQDNDIIQKNYVRLENTLEAPNLLGYLYQEGVLSGNDKEKIGTKSTSMEQNHLLLDTLLKRKDGLKMLIKALLYNGVQAFLGHELLESVSWSEEEMATFKLELEGKIDQQQMQKANMTILKRENNQLKAKDAENQKKIKELTERLKEKDEEIKHLTNVCEKNGAMNASKENLKEENEQDVRRRAKLCRTPAFVHKCNAGHRRSKSETR